MNALLLRYSTSTSFSVFLHSWWTKLIFRFLKTLVIAGISILVIITVLFFLMKVLPGGDPLLSQKDLTDEGRRRIIEQYGLGYPVFVQYGNYLRGLFNGTFGLSLLVRQGVPVENFIWQKVQWSVIISVIAILLGVLLAFLFTFFVAFKINGITDRAFSFLTALFSALPAFMLTTLFVAMAGSNSSFPVLFDKTNFISWILPIIAIAIPNAFVDFWNIRSSIVRISSQQFVKFASIKGITRSKIIVKHVIPQALLPLAARLPLQFAGAITLTLLIEGIFGIPGSGQVLSSALSTKDYNVILAIFVIQAFLTGFAYPAQDLLVRLVDPTNRRKK